MTDTIVSDAVASPLDEGIGSISDGEETQDSAGYVGAAMTHLYGSYVRENELPFQNVDTSNEQVDVGPGRAFVEVSNVDVQSDRTDAIDPQYDTTLDDDIVLSIDMPTAETGLGLGTDTDNDLWIAVDTDGTVGSAGDVYIRHGSGLSAPSDPSVKIGTVNTSDGSTTRANDRAALTVRTLDVLGDATVGDRTTSPQRLLGVERNVNSTEYAFRLGIGSNEDGLLQHVDHSAGSLVTEIEFNKDGSLTMDNGLVEVDSLKVLNGSFEHNRATVSSNTTTSGEGYISVDTSGGSVTITLASADANDGQEINVKRNGSNSVTIDTEGSETIDGSSSTSLGSDDASVTLVFNSDNSDWETY